MEIKYRSNVYLIRIFFTTQEHVILPSMNIETQAGIEYAMLCYMAWKKDGVNKCDVMI